MSITGDDAWKIYQAQNGKCALSGVPIDFKGVATASLDRINSDLGYTKDNVWWVHKTVNRMKWVLKVKDFVEWSKRIADYGHRTTIEQQGSCHQCQVAGGG